MMDLIWLRPSLLSSAEIRTHPISSLGSLYTVLFDFRDWKRNWNVQHGTAADNQFEIREVFVDGNILKITTMVY